MSGEPRPPPRPAPLDRDVRAFEKRASTYDTGWRGRLHRDIATATADVVLALQPPRRLLDVGCGTGMLLGLLAGRLRDTEALCGIDAAETMVKAATATRRDPRLRFAVGVAEALPYRDASFDLVVSTTSFDHWRDQRAGLAECHRVLAAGGHLVLTDLFSRWLAPTLLGSRRAKCRTRNRAAVVLHEVGLRHESWHAVMPLVGTVVATKGGASSAVPTP